MSDITYRLIEKITPEQAAQIALLYHKIAGRDPYIYAEYITTYDVVIAVIERDGKIVAFVQGVTPSIHEPERAFIEYAYSDASLPSYCVRGAHALVLEHFKSMGATVVEMITGRSQRALSRSWGYKPAEMTLMELQI